MRILKISAIGLFIIVCLMVMGFIYYEFNNQPFQYLNGWSYIYQPYKPNESGEFGPVFEQAGILQCSDSRCTDQYNGLDMECLWLSGELICKGLWRPGLWGGFHVKVEGDRMFDMTTGGDIFNAWR